MYNITIYITAVFDLPCLCSRLASSNSAAPVATDGHTVTMLRVLIIVGWVVVSPFCITLYHSVSICITWPVVASQAAVPSVFSLGLAEDNGNGTHVSMITTFHPVGVHS